MQILRHGQIAVQAEALRQIPDLRAGLLGVMRQIETADRHAAPIGIEAAADQAHRRRLARAIGPDESVNLAFLHGQTQAVHGVHFVERFV